MSKDKETKGFQEEEIETTTHSLDDSSSDFYDGFNPLDEAVKEREYTKSNINTDNLEAVLEEPSFEAPNFDDFEDAQEEEPKTFNPAMENLDKKEQMFATEQMVDTVLDVYGKAHLLANRFTKIKEEKITTAMREGEISPSTRVAIDENGNTLGLLEYVQEYNAQLSDAIKVEDEFLEKVRPPMIRVFQKKGLAMTDEQFLGVTFGTDILTKVGMIFQLVKQNNKLITMWKEQSSSYAPKQSPKPKSSNKETNNTPPPTPPPTNKKSSDDSDIERSKPERVYVEPEEFTAESMVNDMMGMKEESSFTQTKQDDNMPQFGNPSILSKLNELSKNDSNKNIEIVPSADKTKKPKRGRPKKNS